MTRFQTLACVLATAGLLAGAPQAQADPFTYQGRLIEAGEPANGSFTVQVNVWSAASGGSVLAGETFPDVPVIDGLFSVEVDLGDVVFNGDPRWLEIIVDGETMQPRQPVTAAPYALFARNAPFQRSGNDVYYIDGNIGIGTSNPENPLHVDGRIRSTGAGAGLTVFNPDNQDASFNVSWLDDVARWRVGGNGAGANGGFDFQRIGDQSLFRIDGDGFIGIGTSDPQRELHISDSGDARIWLEADTNNSGEGDQPHILMTQDGGLIEAALGFFNADNIFSIRTADVGNPNNGIPLVLDASGGVGMGTDNPMAPLHVSSSLDPAPDNVTGAVAAFQYVPPGPDQAFFTNPAVSIETEHVPGPALRVENLEPFGRAATFWGGIESFANQTGNGYGVRGVTDGDGAGVVAVAADPGNGVGLEVWNTQVIGVSDIAVFKVQTSGNVARIDTTGRGFFNNGTQTGGADVAEAFEVEGDVSDYEPGDVLAISVQADRTVTLSTEAYSTLVAGVHATKPGVLLTERDVDACMADLVPMGVVGVIPTKVSGENGPIRRGDLLVSASLPGHAMKGTDRSRMLGAVIGKALEDFDGDGAGLIKVMVNVK